VTGLDVLGISASVRQAFAPMRAEVRAVIEQHYGEESWLLSQSAAPRRGEKPRTNGQPTTAYGRGSHRIASDRVR